MNFTLITPKGRIYTFFGIECAIIFQQAYGGTIITNEVLVEASANLPKVDTNSVL